MRVQFIFHGKDKKPHPFHVKSNWKPPVQPSVALETHLQEVKTQLTEIQISKSKKQPASQGTSSNQKAETKPKH